jgi:hypothetical protein
MCKTCTCQPASSSRAGALVAIGGVVILLSEGPLVLRIAHDVITTAAVMTVTALVVSLIYLPLRVRYLTRPGVRTPVLPRAMTASLMQARPRELPAPQRQALPAPAIVITDLPERQHVSGVRHG